MDKIIDKENEVIEIVVNDSELNDLKGKLSESKTHIHFDINNKHLLIHHEIDELLN